MTSEEFQAAKAKLNEVTTEANDLRLMERESIDAARKVNAHTRELQGKIRKLDADANQLRAVIRQHEIEERLKAEKEAAEAKAAAEKAKEEQPS